jgi:hypothetical protein
VGGCARGDRGALGVILIAPNTLFNMLAQVIRRDDLGQRCFTDQVRLLGWGLKFYVSQERLAQTNHPH